MSIFRKEWSPVEADEWTAHDFWASVFSVLAYLLVAIGVAGTLLLQIWGFASLLAGVICVILMFKVIDPKLRSLSADFEMKQREYLVRLERTMRWEAEDGD